jgi:hypothetical protein
MLPHASRVVLAFEATLFYFRLRVSDCPVAHAEPGGNQGRPPELIEKEPLAAIAKVLLDEDLDCRACHFMRV